MLFHAKNGSLSMDGASMDYIRFGAGKRVLIMLPGLGDGLKTVKGTALPMAIMYREMAKAFTVYAFSRRQPLGEKDTTKDMARDLKTAMDILGIEKADVFGVSMGGMIAQHFAVDYPQMVNKLILAVTCPRTNPTLEASVKEWIALAEAGDHTGFMESNLRRIYSEDYYRKNKWMVPLLGRLTQPESYDRFFILAAACLSHDAWEGLDRIQAPTLVIGGEKDLALGGEPSREIAARIPGAELWMYAEWGHGVYEEEKEFNGRIKKFLLK